MYVGAGDVDLQPAYLFLRRQQGAGLGVFLHREAAHVGHDRLVEHLPQPGQLLGDDGVRAGILQPHGVQQPAVVLRDAGGGVAEPGLAGGALEGEGAQHVDVVELRELIAVAEGTAGGDDGVIQPDTAEGDCRVYHRISSFCRTGPSLQMRLVPYFVRQLQPMQAPKPQPMRSSKLNCPEVPQCCHTARSMASGPQVYR